MKNWISTNEKQRFALKKISGKMVSVLVGTTLFGFYLGTKNNIQVVHADTITASSDVSASLETAKTNTETASTTKNTPAATDSTDNTVKDAASITAATNNNQSTTASTTNNDQETAKTATTADQTADTENKTASTTSTDKEAKPVASNATAATNDNSQSLTPSVDPNKTEEASSTAAVPTSETTTVSTSDLNTTNNQNAKSTLATTLLAATNTTASTTSSEEGLPKSDQVFTLVEAPLYNDIVSTEQTKGRESTWLWKVINSGPYHEQGYNEVKRILQDPNLYYFAAFGDYNNSTHRVILVARDKNNLDNPTITVNIVGFDAGMNTETVKVAANTTKTNTYYNSADKGDYTIQNFGNGSYSITLNTFTNGFGLLPVFDSGHLNNDLVNKTESQYNDIARNESIGIYASYIPKPRTQIIRYVDQATGKDIVQPIDISGYGYQPYRTSDVTPPTVDGYTYKGSSGFATDGSEPQYEELGVPTVGYVTEFSVGEAFDFSETSDVMVRSTVIDKDGTIRSVVYYKGKPLNETAGTSGVKILGTNANNNTMNFTINGLQYTFTNPVTATDNSTVYYYAKTGHEQESTMTVHYIDVTKSGLNSNFIPTDGTEVSKQVLTGNIGEAYTNTLEAPKGYKIVANDETAKSGTYSIDEHDAYVYVKQESPLNEQYDPQPNELTANVGDEVPEAKSQIKNTGDLPADTQYAWQTQPDLSKAGTSTAVVRVTYGDGTYDDVNIPVTVTVKQTEADKYTPNVPTTKVPVDDVNNLTDEEKGQVKTNVEKANPDLPSGATVTVGNDGTATITYGDKSTDTIDGKQLVEAKPDADKYTPNVPTTKVPVNDVNNLTDEEKGQVKTNVEKANPGLPSGATVTVGNDGTATITYGDKSTDTIDGKQLVEAKPDADKYTPNVPTTKVPVNDVTNLTDEEKGQVKTNVEKANPDLPSGATVTVGNDGTATITYSDKSTDTLSGSDLVEAKKDNEKYELKPGKEVKVDDTNKLTDPEKQAVGDAIKEANPDAPIKNIAVDDKGKATVTFNDDSTGEVQGNVVAKKDNEKYELKPGKEVKVDDTNKLTDPEKQAVGDAIKEANPDAPIKNIAVDDKGKATVTFNDDSTGEVQGNIVAKKDNDKYELKPGKEVKVDDTNKLTDPEKQAVGDAIKEANPDAPIKNIEVDDKGKATVTFNDDSTGEVQGNVVAKKDNEKYTPNVPTTKVPVNDVTKLTDEEKGQVKTNVEKANPDLPKDAQVMIGDDGTATITYGDESTDTIAGNQLVEGKKDADKYDLKPGKEVKVDDTNKLTDPEKQAVGDAIKEANPDAPIKNIAVDDKGKATVTFNDDSTGEVQGNIVAKKDNEKYDLKPGNEVKVNDPSHLTDEEKQAVGDAIKEANPDAPIKNIAVDDKGKATVTFNDDSTGEVQGNIVAKKDNDKYELKPGKEVKVDDTNKLTDPEKQAVGDAIKEANPDAPIKNIAVDDKGKATVTFNDDSTKDVQGNIVGKSDADKYTPNVPTTKVPVNDVNNLTEEEKGQVKTNVEKANPNLPSGAEVTIGNDGTATITYSDKSTDTIAGNQLVEAKPESEKYTPNVPATKVPVNDVNNLTEEEKGQVKTNVEKANPDLPKDAEVTIGNDGTATITYDDKSTDTISGSELVTKKPDTSTEQEVKLPDSKVEVVDPNHLTDEEKQQVKDNVIKSNPDAKDIKVGDNGDTDVTFDNGNHGHVDGSELVTKKPDTSTEQEVKLPDSKVEVVDPNHLTDEEKQQVKDNVAKSNPDAKDIKVGDNGDTDVTFDNGNHGHVDGSDLVTKKPETPAEQEVKLPDSKVEVSDPNHLTDEEKQQVKDNVIKSNPDAKDVKVGDNGDTDVTFDNGNHGHVDGSELVTKKPETPAEQEVKLPDSKVEVVDPNHLTDEEKQQVKDNVVKSNPDAKDVKVGDNGDTDVTFNNGNHGHVSGDQLIVKSNDSHDNTTDADKHPAVVPGTKVEVADPSHLTDDEKNQVKDNVAKSNPDAKDIKVSDNGDTTLIYNDGSQHNLSGSDLIIKKDNNSSNTSNNTDADNNPAVIPDTKTPVQDPNHLTDAEKNQIKDNVSKSNPNAKDILVSDNADTTLIYGDGSKNVIKGTDLIVVKSTSTISPSKNISDLQDKGKNNKKAESAKETLPQTGESDNILAVISGAAMLILSVVTFGLIKRRKE